jgi:hypothetical protein
MKKLMLLPLLLVACFCFAQDAKEIIGKPVKIGNLLVAEYDFPEAMNWDDAKKSCRALGNGWRLPTNKELRFMYDHRDLISGIKDDSYWSGKEKNNFFGWIFSFVEGQPYGDERKSKHYVRAVRSL